MKDKPIPMPVVLGISGVIVLVICIAAYIGFVKPPAQLDPKTVSPLRLSDPDPGRGPSKRDIYR